MEKVIKHLEFIQGTINRLSTNSFLLKGWSVVLVSALFVLSGKDGQQDFIVLALLPALIFWGLDGYFLRQERLYRKLNGMAESFVKTLKRDYAHINPLPGADTALKALHRWFEDYNENHPHGGLKWTSPRDFIRARTETRQGVR